MVDMIIVGQVLGKNGISAVAVGGDVSNGRSAGTRCCHVGYGPGDAIWYVGAALSPA